MDVIWNINRNRYEDYDLQGENKGYKPDIMNLPLSTHPLLTCSPQQYVSDVVLTDSDRLEGGTLYQLMKRGRNYGWGTEA